MGLIQKYSVRYDVGYRKKWGNYVTKDFVFNNIYKYIFKDIK